MKPYKDYLNEDQRLVLLRLLAEQIAYKSNSSVLTRAMDALGHSVSRDAIRTHLAWLAEQRLVTLDELIPGLIVATLTERGHDVAAGRAVTPGVARPGA
jgi:Fe2+ or Zn2+ uptake regulation protein